MFTYVCVNYRILCLRLISLKLAAGKPKTISIQEHCNFRFKAESDLTIEGSNDLKQEVILILKLKIKIKISD